jgi:hypothetical protein
MLTNAAYRDWCHRLQLSEAAVADVTAIRQGQPVRRVAGGNANVVGRYMSRKMGVSIQFESHKVELPFVIQAEHDPRVLEYYDQPSTIPLRYAPGTGGRRQITARHTPDFFVIWPERAEWVECKPEDVLIRLAEKNPNRYVRGPDGLWHCPPGEAYATALGLMCACPQLARSSRL